MSYLVVLTGSILFYFLFKGVRLFFTNISSEKRYFPVLWMALNITEFVLWIIIVFWSIDKLLSDKSYYPYILITGLVILIGLLTYYFINDLVAGAIFKIQHHPQKGKFYDFKKYSGKVLKVGATGLLLETSEGQKLDIPFSEIKGPVFERKELKAQTNIVMHIKADKKEPKEVAMGKIYQAIFTSAYSSLKEEPVLKVVKEDEQYFYFEVMTNTMNSRHQAFLENEINEALQS